jgi:ribosomal-protein-alanine N-acetyltransferase
MLALIDLRGLKNLEETAHHLAYLHTLGFEKPWPKDDFLNYLTRPFYECYGLALDKDVYVGFIILSIVADEAEVLTVLVHADYQNQGHAKTMVSQTLNVTAKKGLKSMYLEVAIDNHYAICLYKSQGFSVVGTRPNYYITKKGSKDALVLTLKF